MASTRGEAGDDRRAESNSAWSGPAGRIDLAREDSFRLGALEVEPSRRRVALDDGREEILEPRVMQVLAALARADGRIVSREELLQSCWPGVTVGMDALNRAISQVRRLAEGLGAGVFMVENIPRVGYRLTGARIETRRIGAVVRPTVVLPDKPSIAVLPFRNLSGDPEQEYLADAISEDIVTALSRWRWFFVIARASSFIYKNRDVEPARIGVELGVRYLLAGSVRSRDDRVRVAAQLGDAATGSSLWADRFDRPMSDVFELQDEISQHVAAAIEPALLEGEAARTAAKPGPTLSALDCFYRGMWWGNKLTPEGDAKSLGLFQEAVRLDPDFALGHAGIARALYAQALYDNPAFRDDLFDGSRIAAREAIRLDAREAMGHYAAAGAELYLANHGVAEDEARQTVELNPSFAYAHYRLGQVLVFAGRPSEALAPLELSLKLNPFDPQLRPMMETLALALYQARDYAAALEQSRRASRFGGGAASAVQVAAAAKLGRLDEAVEALGRIDRAKTSRQRPLPAPWAIPADLDHVREGYRAARRARGDKV